jgi:hypothetical protein
LDEAGWDWTDSDDSTSYEESLGSEEEAKFARDKVYVFGPEEDESDSDHGDEQRGPLDARQQGPLFGKFSHQKATEPVMGQTGMFIRYTISEDRTGNAESILMNILAHLNSRCLLEISGGGGEELPVTKFKPAQVEPKARLVREDESLRNPTLLHRNQISALPHLSVTEELSHEENVEQLWEILTTTTQRKAYDRAYAELIELSGKLLAGWQIWEEQQRKRDEEQ